MKSMKIEPVNIMEVTNNGVVGQYKKNDIVGIVTLDNTCHIGRITFIDTESLEIDASKEFKSNIKTIKYKSIESVKIINSKQDI